MAQQHLALLCQTPVLITELPLMPVPLPTILRLPGSLTNLFLRRRFQTQIRHHDIGPEYPPAKRTAPVTAYIDPNPSQIPTSQFPTISAGYPPDTIPPVLRSFVKSSIQRIPARELLESSGQNLLSDHPPARQRQHHRKVSPADPGESQNIEAVLQSDAPPLIKQSAHACKRRRKQQKPAVKAQIPASSILSPPAAVPGQQRQHDQQTASCSPHALGKPILAAKCAETPKQI